MDAGALAASPDTQELRVHSMTYAAEGVMQIELRAVSGAVLPSFSAGAHIDLHLPIGLRRSYSLTNDPRDRARYAIAVGRDRASRGGSRFVHEVLRPGDVLKVSAPRNNFPLHEDAADTLLIAGGIGVTPIVCMIRRLEALRRPWRLHYCARTRAQAALLETLTELSREHPERLVLTFDGEGGASLDIAAVVAAEPPSTHLYCCGPGPMLAAFEAAVAGRPAETVHVEYFAAREVTLPVAGEEFVVTLAKSGLSLTVPAGKSILDVLIGAGVEVSHSCLEGVCGACETSVLEGIPEHRDTILTPAERAAAKSMMICCSRSKSSRLVLDL